VVTIMFCSASTLSVIGSSKWAAITVPMPYFCSSWMANPPCTSR
jgi:hypothetical protein